jgi:hypothetical protein
MTETDIANRALSLLGEPSISSIEENTPNAISCRLHFETVRDALLRSHGWDFATTRVTLSRSAYAPSFGWAYGYHLPADFVRLVTFNDANADEARTSFEIEGGQLLTHSGAAQISYVRRITDPNEFDALFLDVVAYRRCHCARGHPVPGEAGCDGGIRRATPRPGGIHRCGRDETKGHLADHRQHGDPRSA